jgi:EAL and modified HD-GYP domain-containing signal transduction protein
MVANGPESSIFLARQPIYDRHLSVFAYELLYRSGSGLGAGNVGPKESAATFVRAIIEIGLEKLVGNRPAFINVPHYLLGDPVIHLLPMDRVVLEILEDSEPTAEALEAVSVLFKMGYRLALDDFVFGSPQIEFLPFVKFVKLDLIENSPKMLSKCIEMLKGSGKRLIAEKVENMEMFSNCQSMGCHLFQGYFCSKPEVVKGKKVPSSLGHLTNLVNRLSDPNVRLEDLEKHISVDVGLSYRLLRMVNSAVSGSHGQIESIHGALLVLGLEKVTSLVSLLALAGIEDRPSELLLQASIRAKMCELLAPVMGFKDPAKHFMVGLLSVLEALFDISMQEILTQIPLAPELKKALLDPNDSGPLGQTLRIALAFESGRWEFLSSIYERAPEIGKCYIEAVQWADKSEQIRVA